MDLFIKDEQGRYVTATTLAIIKEGRNRTRSTLKKGSSFIRGSEAAKEAIASKISSYQHEVFGCLFLDTKNCILEWKEMFQGTIDSTTVYPREEWSRKSCGSMPQGLSSLTTTLQVIPTHHNKTLN